MSLNFLNYNVEHITVLKNYLKLFVYISAVYVNIIKGNSVLKM